MKAAVAFGKQNDARASGENVVLHDRLPLFKNARVRGSRVG